LLTGVITFLKQFTIPEWLTYLGGFKQADGYGASMSKSDSDNHANQMNENNDAYWQSRGEDERPDDWEDQQAEEKDA